MGWRVSPTPWHLYPRERPGTHTGGWVDPRAGLDERKISSLPGFDPRTVQPVASRYTYWATRPKHYILYKGIYVHARARGATAPTVLMVWQQASDVKVQNIWSYPPQLSEACCLINKNNYFILFTQSTVDASHLHLMKPVELYKVKW